MIETNGNWLLEILQYCTSGFFVFIGTLILISLMLEFVLKAWAVFWIGISHPSKWKAINDNSDIVKTEEEEKEK